MDGTQHIQCADLFCGVGGLSYGLQKAGIDVRVGVDKAPSTEYPYTANINRPVIVDDIKNVTSDRLLPFLGRVKLLAGCAPCQPFSTLSPKSVSDGDARRSLIYEFLRIAIRMRPEIILMENVPSLQKTGEFKGFLSEIKRIGYHIACGIINFSDYGVPQSRKRLIVLASRLGSISLPDPDTPIKHTCVGDVIRAMPPVQAGQINDVDPVHSASALSKINLRRIRSSKPGGTWLDWEPDLLSGCHKRTDGKHFLDSYGRMDWNKTAPTLTTRFFVYGCGRFGHPEQDRAITFREAAMLQTFPQDYKFVPENQAFVKTELGTLIGNAVPPRIGQILGNTIIDHVKHCA